MNSKIFRGQGERTRKHGFIYRFHPSLNRRIVQLKRMGANVEWNDRRDHSDFVDAILVGASSSPSQLCSCSPADHDEDGISFDPPAGR